MGVKITWGLEALVTSVDLSWMGQAAPRRFWKGSDRMDHSCTRTALSTVQTLACCTPTVSPRMIGRPPERAAGPGETWTRMVAVATMERGQALRRLGARRPCDVRARGRRGSPGSCWVGDWNDTLMVKPLAEGERKWI